MTYDDDSIVIAGDWHGDERHAARILEVAEQTNSFAVFQVGDFGYWEHESDGVRYLDEVNDIAQSHGIMVYFLDGNHDKTSLLLESYTERDAEGFIEVRPWICYAPRGHRWQWNDTRFIALGGAYSVDKEYRLRVEAYNNTPGALWFPEEEMSDEDMDKILVDTSPVDVILSHDKPRASNPDWNRKDIPRCYPNQDRLQRAVTALKPKLLIHGHLHYRYTSLIRCGDDDKFTQVEGLGTNYSAHDPSMGDFRLKDTYMVYGTRFTS